MAYTNSPLVTYKNITKNKTSNRQHTIDTITIHCTAGQVTAKACVDYFATTKRQCSSNYVVGKDGSIGLSVEEKDRSWCTSSSSNDHRAITIEVSSDTKTPYAVTDTAYEALIKLVADICSRNNIKKLNWKADKSLIGKIEQQNMTVHRWFSSKSCPGVYLYDRHNDIVNRVNKLIGASIEDTTEVIGSRAINVGDVVKISSDAVYYNGKKVPTWVINKTWVVSVSVGDRVVIDKSNDGKNSINSPINASFLTVVKSNTSITTTPSDTKPSTTNTPSAALGVKVGDIVRVTNTAVYFNGKSVPEWIKKLTWVVKEVNGSRVVIDRSTDNKYSICSAIKDVYLIVVDKSSTAQTTLTVKKGSQVKIANNATYWSGKKIPNWVISKTWVVTEVKDNRAIIDKSVDGRSSICSPINVAFLSVVK